MNERCVPSEIERARAAGVRLRALLAGGAQLSADSRRIEPGDGFLAWRGARTDATRFIGQALANGAAAVVLDDATEEVEQLHGSTVLADGRPVANVTIRVPRLARVAGHVAAAYYEDPSAAMRCVAITGTNGKTSCAQWTAAGLADLGAQRCAALGTLGTVIHDATTRDAGGAPTAVADDTEDGAAAGAVLTTPDAVALQRRLARLRAQGTRAVALEASSIGLEQQRLAGCAVEVAVFTNLGRDHLDHHLTLDAYRAAKARLFRMPGLRTAIVNGDDPASAAMLGSLAAQVRTVAYGFEPRRHAPQAQSVVRIAACEATGQGMALTFEGDFGTARVQVPLVGRFNASNALACCLAWHALGVDFQQAVAALQRLRPVPGRMEQVGGDGSPLVVVDYAHTPDALSVVLEALRPLAQARAGLLWCVFGCGGDRDAGKRALMGACAAELADRVVLTSDNPRGEDPARIIAEIRAGLPADPWMSESDRALAIQRAIGTAANVDVVLLAGKGHEAWQEVAGRRLPFDDREHARRALAARPAGALQ